MSQLEQALQKFAAVVGILTAENTVKRLSDTVDNIEEVTSQVMDISQQAAADVVSIFEDILQEMEVVGTARRLTMPGDDAQRQRARDLLLSHDTPEEI